MKEQTAIDRILETENLTDGLEDADANWLLDWGIGKLPALIDNLEDDEAAGLKVNQLMNVMRKINQIIADRQVKSIEELAEDLRILQGRYQAAFSGELSSSHDFLADRAEETAAQVAGLSPRRAMQALVEVLQSSIETAILPDPFEASPTPSGSANESEESGGSPGDQPELPENEMRPVKRIGGSKPWAE